MPANSPEWLDIVRHRVRRLPVPFLLIVQHHLVPSARRLVAPVTLPMPSDVDALAPRVTVNGTLHRIRVLDMFSLALPFIGETVMSLADDRDGVMNALDVVLHGYPVGLSRPH